MSIAKDTDKKKLLSNKATPVLSKNMNVNIWVVGTSKQPFIRGSDTKFSKNKVVTGKTSSFMVDPSSIHYSIYLKGTPMQI